MMRRKRSSQMLLSVAVVGGLLTGCGDSAGAGAAGADEEVYEWDFVQFVGAQHHYTQLAQEFADDVRERTDGRLDITVRPAGELPYSADEYLARVGDGSMEMADSLSTFMAGSCRVGALPALPMLVPDFESFDQIWPDLQPRVEQCAEDAGAQLLYTYLWPSQNIFGTGDPVEEAADLAGRTFRQTSPEHGAMIQAFGAEGITLTTEEVPPAIQRGVMDGVLTSVLNVRSAGWDEFLDWAFIVDAGIAPSYINVNQAAFDELPEDLQEALTEAAAAATERTNESTTETEAAARGELEEAGLTVTEASEEERAAIEEVMKPVWVTYAEDGDNVEALEEIRATLDK